MAVVVVLAPGCADRAHPSAGFGVLGRRGPLCRAMKERLGAVTGAVPAVLGFLGFFQFFRAIYGFFFIFFLGTKLYF